MHRHRFNLDIRKHWHTPLLAAVMEHRLESLVIGGAAAVQVGLVTAHLPGWPCPIRAVLGIPCPGCGLSTAAAELLRGDWQQAMNTHAFAPILLAALALVIAAAFLPEKARRGIIEVVATVERRTGFAAWVLAGLFLYWGLRLFHFI